MSASSAGGLVAPLALSLLDRGDLIVDQLATRIGDQVEVYGAGGLVDRADLEFSLADNLRHILGRLSGTSLDDLHVPRRIGRTRAEQDVPLPEVLRAYRLGFAALWEHLLAAARAAGPQALDALIETATQIWELADDYSLAMTEAYREAMSERAIAADRRRSGIVSAILDGPAGHSAWEVAKLLDLPYEGSFLVVVAEVADDQTALLVHAENRLVKLDIASVWRSQPHQEIGVLSLAGREPGAALEVIAASSVGRVGVSPAFGRLDEAPRALRLAQVAVETLPAGVRQVRQLPDEPNVDLLVRDRETTGRFVHRVLHRVLALPDDDRTTLLDTASVWIEARGSAVEASRVLYCHENTVRHRIRRLEEHLGGSLDDPRTLGDLTTALQAIRIFPDLRSPTSGRAASRVKEQQ